MVEERGRVGAARRGVAEERGLVGAARRVERSSAVDEGGQAGARAERSGAGPELRGGRSGAGRCGGALTAAWWWRGSGEEEEAYEAGEGRRRRPA